MKINTDCAEIWNEYGKAKAYNENLDLYDQVKRNEDFFLGNQWEGVKAPDLDKPVLNVLKRVVTYLISALVTDNVGLSVQKQTADPKDEAIARILETEIKTIVEDNKTISKNRMLLRNACVDGKAYYYTYFDTAKNRVQTELIENTRVLFGNPYVNNIQKQPYILIVKPMLLESVRDMVPESERDAIQPDNAEPWEDYEAYGADRTTVLIKLWKENGTVHFCQCTQSVMIRQPTDTGYRIYPLSQMTWEEIRDCYQGQAAVSGLIPNQIAINKLYAMMIYHEQMNAFPKVFYDRTKIPKWNNRVGEAIGVSGNPNDAVAASFRVVDMSAQLFQVVSDMINYTKEMMGASDAALGNIRPDNTSAIIAVQKASSAPLELQKLAFYQCLEDYVRTLIELICAHYGVRYVSVTDENTGVVQAVPFDFSTVDPDQIRWRVDIGASAYWSELTQIQTLDNIFSKGIITDPVQYLENIPDEYIKNKNSLIESAKQAKQQAMMMQQQGGMKNAATPLPGM